MKTITFATAALVAALSATSAFAGNSDYAGDRGYVRQSVGAVDYAPTASVKANTSGYIVTYPTNADSVLNETAAQRNVTLGHQGNN